MPYPVSVKSPQVLVWFKKPPTFLSFFFLFLFMWNCFLWTSIVWMTTLLKIIAWVTSYKNLFYLPDWRYCGYSLLRLQYLGTVQTGRHKSTSLNIFSHLVKLHAHVQHKTCIDHIPERQWLATTKEPHKCPLDVSLTLFNHLIPKESSHINFQLCWPVLGVCSDMLFYCMI
jgi:hypothetical protein